MIYVLDTHAFVWWATGGRRLGRAAARIFSRAERGLDVLRLPSVAAFEIALLVERGRVKTALPWRQWVEALESTPGLQVEPLLLADVERARELAALVDPFDRLVAATALRLECALVTADERIGASGLVPVVW
jgi:PIN domain nuclease of toxin-antitoxin system